MVLLSAIEPPEYWNPLTIVIDEDEFDAVMRDPGPEIRALWAAARAHGERLEREGRLFL